MWKFSRKTFNHPLMLYFNYYFLCQKRFLSFNLTFRYFVVYCATWIRTEDLFAFFPSWFTRTFNPLTVPLKIKIRIVITNLKCVYEFQIIMHLLHRRNDRLIYTFWEYIFTWNKFLIFWKFCLNEDQDKIGYFSEKSRV